MVVGIGGHGGFGVGCTQQSFGQKAAVTGEGVVVHLTDVVSLNATWVIFPVDVEGGGGFLWLGAGRCVSFCLSFAQDSVWAAASMNMVLMVLRLWPRLTRR
jgi:hypothetical protein